MPRFIQRRTIWWPTWPTWLLILALGGTPAVLWFFQGEKYLSRTMRLPAEVLVVEGWIGVEGVRAAQAEFAQGGYDYILITGGLNGHPWQDRRWSLIEIGRIELLRLQVPEEKIITASSPETDSQRTHAAAVAAWQALQDHDLHPAAVNVFTLGAHARRSRLVFAKVFQSSTQVGVVSWIPDGYATDAWWHSSEHAETMLKETVGYLYEVLLNSGRTSNSPPKG